MAIREDKMGQCQALPTSIRDLIPDDHIVNLVIAVVNTVDLKEIEAIREIIERGIAIDEEEDELYGDKRGDELYKERIELSYNSQSLRFGHLSLTWSQEQWT